MNQRLLKFRSQCPRCPQSNMFYISVDWEAAVRAAPDRMIHLHMNKDKKTTTLYMKQTFSEQKYVWGCEGVTFNPKNTVPTVKHRGGSMILWDCYWQWNWNVLKEEVIGPELSLWNSVPKVLIEPPPHLWTVLKRQVLARKTTKWVEQHWSVTSSQPEGHWLLFEIRTLSLK